MGDSEEHVDLVEMQSEININFNEDSASDLKSAIDSHEQSQLIKISEDDIQRQIQENKKRKKKRKRNKTKQQDEINFTTDT